MDRQRIIVVTGADRGLGYELTRQYLTRGDKVFAGKFRIKWNLLDNLKEQFPDTLIIVDMDVSSTQSVRAAAAAILAQTDKIDVLINNAGVWLSHDCGTVLEDGFDYERMAKEININALGALRVTQALIHAILNSFDKLVANISSEAGSITGCRKTSQPGYCMSKAAMNMQSVVVLNAIRPLGGQVINLHPGWMQSVIGSPCEADAEMVELPDHRDVKFYVTPAQSAAGFIKILDNPERFAIHNPGFVNFMGDMMVY
jgi:NAD(P)-dependent dehydrogenase (short-subunit alcohol dehydrogenase family)